MQDPCNVITINYFHMIQYKRIYIYIYIYIYSTAVTLVELIVRYGLYCAHAR